MVALAFGRGWWTVEGSCQPYILAAAYMCSCGTRAVPEQSSTEQCIARGVSF
jgi:hypothetical protein